MLRTSLVLILLDLTVASVAVADTDPNQWGITWTLDHDYTVGQFANGDFYVVADTVEGSEPNVVIIDVDPGATDISQDGETFSVNGNMVNPDPEAIGGGHQAYDERTGTGTYNATLLVDVPIVLKPNESLVSTISWQIGEDGCPARYDSNPAASLYHMPRPPLRVAAVLTCLAEAPPAGTMRPPYAGTNKPLYDSADINVSLLPDLTPASGMDTFSNICDLVDHCWLDHVTSEQGEWHNPTENMSYYGRNQMSNINLAILALCTNLTEEQKTELATYVCQIGIDEYYVVANGGGWGKAGGAMRIGRKWPILFTGWIMGIQAMEDVGSTYAINSSRFQEDSQLFYISQTEVDQHAATTRTNCTITHEDYGGNQVAIVTDADGGSWWDDDLGGTQPIQSGRGFPSDFWLRVNRGGGNYDVVRASAIHESNNAKLRVNENALTYYGLLDTGSGLTVEIQLFPEYRIGEPEWAENYIWRNSTLFYSRGYRTVSCKAWSGAMLASLATSTTDLWGHDLFFEEVDFFMGEQDVGSDDRSHDAWTAAMWDLYRDDYTWPASEPNEPEEPDPVDGTKYILILRN